MNSQEILDRTPIVVVFAAIVVALLLVYELGYRAGRWWQERRPDEHEGPTGVLVGSLLATMAFLIAVTMGMAADRFDSRRALVLDESNAIGTTFLRAGFLPGQERDEVRDLLREYAPLRIDVADPAWLESQFRRSEEIHAELWTITESVQADSETFSLFADALSDMIEVHEARVAAIVYSRIPETIVVVLLIGAALTIAMVGYGGGITNRRSVVGAVVLVMVLTTVLTLVIDLDRPRDGFLQVSQQPLIDLQRDIGQPSP